MNECRWCAFVALNCLEYILAALPPNESAFETGIVQTRNAVLYAADMAQHLSLPPHMFFSHSIIDSLYNEVAERRSRNGNYAFNGQS